ncbi:MAG: hypothetical protein FWE23_04980, partial [Chitinivibrionia bacterium]|nr:hypothetical protein [Chitinivibrionia bacterium]
MSKLIKVFAAIGIVASVIFGGERQMLTGRVDLLDGSREWLSNSGRGNVAPHPDMVLVPLDTVGGKFLSSGKVAWRATWQPFSSDWTNAPWGNVFISDGAEDWSNLRSIEITYTASTNIILTIVDDDGAIGHNFAVELPAGTHTRTLDLWSFRQDTWVQVNHPHLIKPLGSILNYITGLAFNSALNPAGGTATAEITRLVANFASGSVNAGAGVNLLDAKWIDHPLSLRGPDGIDGLGSHTTMTRNGESMKMDFFYALNQSCDGTPSLPSGECRIHGWDGCEMKHAWAPVEHITDGDWSKVTGMKITYTSSRNLHLLLADVGHPGGFEVILPASPTPRTAILNPRDFRQPDWINSLPILQTNLDSRFRALSGIIFMPNTHLWGVGTTAEIFEFTVYGLEQDPRKRDLTNDIDGWKTSGDATVNGRDQEFFTFTINAADAYVDYEFAGDWSGYRGLEFVEAFIDESWLFSLLTTQGEIPFPQGGQPKSTEIPAADETSFSPLGFFELGMFEPIIGGSNWQRVRPSVLTKNVIGFRFRPYEYTSPITFSFKNLIAHGVAGEPEDIEVIWEERTSFAYNGAIQMPAATARTKNGMMLPITITSEATKDVGNYTATASLAGNPNINLTGATRNFSIIRAEISPTLTYTTRDGLEIVGNIGGGNEVILWSRTARGEFSNGTLPTEAGTYF